jgi:hypothetical protein
MSTSRRSRSLSSGVRVLGRYGELVANPRGLKRRVRQRLFGVIVCAAGEHKYHVKFENDLEKVSFSTSLRVESHVIGVPLIESLPLLPAAQEEEAQGKTKTQTMRRKRKRTMFETCWLALRMALSRQIVTLTPMNKKTSLAINISFWRFLVGGQSSRVTDFGSIHWQLRPLLPPTSRLPPRRPRPLLLEQLQQAPPKPPRQPLPTPVLLMILLRILVSTQEGMRTQRMEQAMSRSSIIGNKKSKKCRARLWR